MKKSLFVFFAWLLSISAASVWGAATDAHGEIKGWPRTITANGITAEIYQPQLDSWDNLEIQTHSAMAVTFPGGKTPIYGVLYLDATTQVDRPSRTARIDRVKRFAAKFPSDTQRENQFVNGMKEAVLRDVGAISLDRIEAALSIMQAERRGQAQPVKNDPPKILFSRKPALLLYVDGTPRWTKVADTPLERVLNTRVLLLRDAAHRYYLHYLDGYLTSDSLSGPWSIARNAPAGATKAEQHAREGGQIDLLAGQPDEKSGKRPSLIDLPVGEVPQVFVETAPAELLVSNGEPNYVSLEGTDLLYVDNTSGNIFKYLGDQKNYVLLSGRWFSADSLDGPWQYVPPKQLPPDFARIPDSSAKENVKASVPGTVQAREAVIANEIPQTAKIDRAKTSFVPVIDGVAELRPIDGTPLEYVFNAADPIIRVDANTWYALHNGVWFVATSVNGPWAVATIVPAVIYSIPVSSSLHYVTYVRIYEVTPTVVVIGYTPGYYGSIVTTDGIVVYGTGYVYDSWTGAYWYGQPVSYGVGADLCWTPWGGWAFGFAFGWAWGWADYGWWYPPAPWWGPYWGGAYYNRYGGVTAWGPGGWAGTTGNVYQRWGNAQTVSRGFAGFDAYSGNRFAGRYGAAYNSRTGAVTAGRQGAVQNVFSGNYAAGGQGARFNPTTGIASRGGRVTVGNEATGRSATIGHVDAYSARTGREVDAGRISGSGGGSIGHINDNVYAGKDGHVYHYDSDTHQWQPMLQGGSRQESLNRTDGRIDNRADNRIDNTPRSLPERNFESNNISEQRDFLDRDRESREIGNLRSDSFRDHGAQFSRPSFGGGRGFGGFGGGGFRGGFHGGFRR